MPRKTTNKLAPVKKRSPRATVTTIHHAPGAKALLGSEERAEMLSGRAWTLKVRGYTLRQIGEMLAKEFELTEVPPTPTVYRWVENVSMSGRKGKVEESEALIQSVIDRGEEMIKALIPAALDDFVVRHYQMMDGVRVPVIDEDVFRERVAACAEIRKQHETMMKALGITKPQGPETATNAQAMQLFVIQSITNHMAKPGEIVAQDRKQKVLELCSGDALIDGL